MPTKVYKTWSVLSLVVNLFFSFPFSVVHTIVSLDTFFLFLLGAGHLTPAAAASQARIEVWMLGYSQALAPCPGPCTWWGKAGQAADFLVKLVFLWHLIVIVIIWSDLFSFPLFQVFCFYHVDLNNNTCLWWSRIIALAFNFHCIFCIILSFLMWIWWFLSASYVGIWYIATDSTKLRYLRKDFSS